MNELTMCAGGDTTAIRVPRLTRAAVDSLSRALRASRATARSSACAPMARERFGDVQRFDRVAGFAHTVAGAAQAVRKRGALTAIGGGDQNMRAVFRTRG